MRWFDKFTSEKELYNSQELNLLEEEIRLAKRQFRRHFKEVRSPKLYLLLGPSCFGKSTLLANSSLELVDIDLQPLREEVASTKNCVFWFSKEGIFIDTAGIYTRSEIEEYSNQVVWKGFIQLLQKYFGKQSIHGLLLIFDLPRLLVDEHLLNEVLVSFRERVYETKQQLSPVNLFLLFTKCDRLSGFRAFSHYLSEAESLQPFGLWLRDTHKDLLLTFKQRFAQLSYQVSLRGLEILKQGGVSEFERSFIKLFTLEFKHLEGFLAHIVSKVPTGHQIRLQGLFFTSSYEQDQPVAMVQNSLLQRVGIPVTERSFTVAKVQRHYFIQQLFKIILALPVEQKELTVFSARGLINLGFWGILFSLLVMSWRGERERLLEVENFITGNYTYSANVLDYLNRHFSSWRSSRLAGLDHLGALERVLAQQERERTWLLIVGQVEKKLKDQLEAKELDFERLRDSLKVYRKLARPGGNEAFLKQWLSQNLGINWGYHKTKQRVALDKDLILQGEDYLLIESNRRFIEEAGAKKKLEIQGVLFEIPELYLRRNFDKFYKIEIPRRVKRIFYGEEKNFKRLIKRAQQLYLQSYLGYWQRELMRFVSPETWNLEHLKMLNQGLQAEFILLVKNNVPAIDTPEVKEFKHLLAEEGLEQLKQKFALTYRLLVELKESGGAVKWLKEYYRTNGELLTHFEQRWKSLGYVAETREQFLVSLQQLAAKEIAVAWNQQVVPAYKRFIAGRYPFVKDSQRELTLSELSDFFGPGGILERFFNGYLHPFIVVGNHLNWEWKKLANEPLNFGSYFLEVGLRGVLIQKIFYAQGVNPAFDFSLTNLKEVKGGEVSWLVGEHRLDLRSAPHIVWPSEEVLTLSYFDGKKQATVTASGLWAWLRLVDQLVISDVGDGRYVVSLGENKVTLVANSFNPFLPGVLTEFVCRKVME